jgi:hypothetical protein
MRSIVTGSHAYGNPRPDSDIDLVVLVSKTDLKRLHDCRDEPSSGLGEFVERAVHASDGGATNGSYLFGRLNLICVTELAAFECWKDGTKALVKRKPVSRKAAIRFFRELRFKRGLGPNPDKLPDAQERRTTQPIEEEDQIPF